jgi:hypothetical protein
MADIPINHGPKRQSRTPESIRQAIKQSLTIAMDQKRPRIEGLSQDIEDLLTISGALEVEGLMAALCALIHMTTKLPQFEEQVICRQVLAAIITGHDTNNRLKPVEPV